MARQNLIRIAALSLLTALGMAASSAGYSEPPIAAAAAAATPSEPDLPSFTPPAGVSASEMMRLRDGLAAADARDWIGVALQRDRAEDPIVRKLLQWRYAFDDNAPLEFAPIAAALRDLQGWPGRNTIRTRAEKAIFNSTLGSSDRIAFLRQDGEPVSGDGRIALAEALRSTGNAQEANEIARKAWREDTLSPTAESVALNEFSNVFSSDDYAARVDILLWRGDRTGATRLFGHISTADRLLAQARIALQVRQRRGLQAAVDAVPASRRDNASLLYDRARYIRRSGRPEDAMPVAARIDARQAAFAARDEIYDERRLYVPRALRTGAYRTAYALVTNTGLTSGEEFADAEWLAGWISLKYLSNPTQAAEHFAHLDANVSSPVSSSRALYWRAQAAKALGQNEDANSMLRRAAAFSFTYYGQLSAQQLGGGVVALPTSGTASNRMRTQFENLELVRALRAVAEVGDQRDYERIAFYLDDVLANPEEIDLLAQIAREQTYTRAAVRSAKAGLFRNVVAAESAYPLIDLPARVRTRTRPEPALVLSVIRQESEFDYRTVSHANARGLMQLLPSTARLVARSEGLPYQPTHLTSDPDYNVTLGASYLGSLIDDFNGSYVLALAAYNAGPNRAREWIADWGDPRAPSTDVVDWVEQIPFTETKNYVQRIMENLQVYRHRLSGDATPITLMEDLRRGD